MSGLGEPAPCPATRTAEIGSVPPESTSGKPNSIPPDSGLNGAAREHDKAGEDAVCVEAEDSRIQSPSPADAGLTPFVAACAAFASLNSANLGYDIGVSGGAWLGGWRAGRAASWWRRRGRAAPRAAPRCTASLHRGSSQPLHSCAWLADLARLDRRTHLIVLRRYRR